MADFIPVESSDVKNVIFMFLVIFRCKRPRFASFFIRQPRQKSNPRLIRSFPARLIKWRHLPPRWIETESQG